MSYRLQICTDCRRQAKWRAEGRGLQSAKILVAVPAATYDNEALGRILHPDGLEFAWLEFLFHSAGYPFKLVRKTCAVRCAGDKRPLQQSLVACRRWLAEEIKATGARAVVLVGPTFWGPLLHGDLGVPGYDQKGATFTFGEDIDIPVFFVRAVEDAKTIESALLPPVDFLRDLKAVADAVATVTGASPAIIDPELAFRAFLKQFIGYTEPRALLGNPGELKSDEKASKRLEALGFTPDMHHHVFDGIRDLFLYDSEGFRTLTYYSQKRSGKRPRLKKRWNTMARRRASDNLIAMHLTGELPLASFKPANLCVLSLDIDKHNDFQRAHFKKTIVRVRRLFPKGLLVRSSHSGGAHLLLFLATHVSYKELVSLARLYLQRHGLGTVRVGQFAYEAVEVPGQGLRLPLGLGSFPLLPGLGEDIPVPETLSELFKYSAEETVLAADLFLDERREVEERLRKAHRISSTESRTEMAAQLLREEQAKGETPISDAELKSRLKADPYGSYFTRARTYIKRLYVVGIEVYGTRSKVTPRLAVRLATIGCSEAKAVEILTYWVNNRQGADLELTENYREIRLPTASPVTKYPAA